MNILTHKREKCRSQKGSVVIHVAIFLSLAVILFIGTELGYLFYLKREFQKTADLAALAGAQALNSNDCSPAYNAAKSNANDGFNRNMPAGFSLEDLDMICGNWSSNNTANTNNFNENSILKNALQVNIKRTPPPFFIFFSGNREISVRAIAARQNPQAALNIRSTLLAVDTTQSPLLNAVIGSLLGGELKLEAVSWNGLINSKIGLLEYLDALAIEANISAGNYEALLQAEVTTGQLLQAAISALQKQSETRPGEILNLAIEALKEIKNQIKISPISPLKVGEILNVQTGTPSAGLETEIQVFKLMEGIVQLANSHSAAAAKISIPLPGVGTVLVKVKAIEPPQVSAVGNPALAKADPIGPDQISVQTAQIRALISIELQGLTTLVNDLLNSTLAQISPLTNFVNNVLHLNLLQGVGDLLGTIACPVPLLAPECPSSEVIYTKVAPTARIDVGIEAANGQAYIKDYSCNSMENKTLLVPATTAAVTLRVGQWGTTPSQSEEKFFPPEEALPGASKKMPQVDPVSLVEIGKQTARPEYCALLVLCGDWKWRKGTNWIVDRKQADFILESALGIRADTSVLGSSENLSFSSPIAEHLPEISNSPYYQEIKSQNLISSLKTTLSGIEIKAYKSTASGVLGSILFDTANLLNLVTKSLGTVLSELLSPILDSLVNFILDMLGLDIAKVEVGGRLSCKRGAELVY